MTSQYQFVEEFTGLSFESLHSLPFLHFYIGIDGLSLYFVLLTAFITPICILSN
jgi:NADH-ubiquinone oxidoreductase chain 4